MFVINNSYITQRLSNIIGRNCLTSYLNFPIQRSREPHIRKNANFIIDRKIKINLDKSINLCFNNNGNIFNK